jgi:acetyl esterase/lipase
MTVADAETMAATRAYLATMPRMVVAADSREFYDQFIGRTPAADGVRFESGTVAGVSGWWSIPENPLSDAALVHFHGGGYVMGSALAFRNFVSHLAQQAGVRTFIPEYALAPEAPFPAALDEAVAIIRELGEDGRTSIAVSGDSAGGGLALSAVQATGSTAAALVLISPWTDLTLASASIRERADSDPILSHDALAAAAASYALTHDRADARLSPRFGSFSAAPPIMVHVGTDEILFDDSMAIAEASGARVDLHVWEGMTHVFPANLAALEAAREAVARSSAFIRSQIAGSRSGRASSV